MNTTSTISSSPMHATMRNRSGLRMAAMGALAATVANVALWVGGRSADVDFLVTPVGADQAARVGVVAVTLTTAGMFAVGWALVSLAARRSRRWAHGVIVTAAVFAVLSTGGPLWTAHDTATGVLLASMHLVTGAAFVTTAARVRAR